MRFSIITPTHNAVHLNRLEASLARQTRQDFEWIVVTNGETWKKALPLTLPCARVLHSPRDTGSIGFLKKHAGFAARGEIIVEVDHDDELIPTALAELDAAFTVDVDFVYSNFCNIDPSGSLTTFGAQHGWRTRPFDYEGRTLTETIAFAPSPAAFSKIWYAPNHIRAWRRAFYLEIGGHDESLQVLDDQDLLCRTYLKGKVKHLDRPLYLYYIHAQNTCYGEANAAIQEQTLLLHDKYIYQLVERWCALEGLRKLDLCGAFNKPAGYEGLDVAGADITADLDQPWPIESGTVGVIRAHDALEHLRSPIHVMKEAYRCLAPHGWFLIQVPSTDGRGAFQDPTHVSFWNSNSFWYYCRADIAKYIGTPVRFQLSRLNNFYPSEWHKANNIIYTKADLVKLVEARGELPGPIDI